jgi:hypothetical protein
MDSQSSTSPYAETLYMQTSLQHAVCFALASSQQLLAQPPARCCSLKTCGIMRRTANPSPSPNQTSKHLKSSQPRSQQLPSAMAQYCVLMCRQAEWHHCSHHCHDPATSHDRCLTSTGSRHTQCKQSTGGGSQPHLAPTSSCSSAARVTQRHAGHLMQDHSYCRACNQTMVHVLCHGLQLRIPSPCNQHCRDSTNTP